MANDGKKGEAGPVPLADVGVLLREWRAARRLSQLDLSFRARVSSRHISYVETGKSRPSRDMVVRLADALDVPLRERNALLAAAGHAPEYPERALDALELAPMRHAIESILEHQEPYPAFVLSRHWDVLRANRAAERVATFLGVAGRHANMVLRFLDPDDLRSVVTNWEEVARDLLRHVQEEVAALPSDVRARALLDEALSYPGVPAHWRTRDLSGSTSPVLTVEFRRGDRRLRFFSTITTFGTARDVTVEELRIECAFPADEATAEVCRSLESLH
jgi:transcriptional regulator with XRE-family HTH domain